MAPSSLTMDALPGPACLIDGATQVVLGANRMFERWTGRTSAVGRRVGELFDPVEGGPAALVEEAVRRAGWAESDNFCAAGLDGTQRYWLLRVKQLPERPDRLLLLAIDITSHALASRAVLEARSDFVGIAAHELRNPLAAIKAWASAVMTKLAAGDAAPDLVADAFRIIARQVDRMNALLTDLLEVARADAGMIQVNPEPVELSELLREAVARSSVADRVELGAVCDVTLELDALKIEHVIHNLLSNAARYGGEGSIVVTASRREGEVAVAIRDQGQGIPREEQVRLFRRFSTGLGSGRGRGTGLGLYICQQFVVAHGGRIWVESEPGQGATFIFTLPERRSHDAPLATVAARTPRLLVTAGAEDAAATLAGVLRRQGYDVVTACDGRQVLARLEAEPFDAVLLDLLLPGMDGSAALESLRARPRMTPVVVVTNGDRAEELSSAERVGARAVLSRPLDIPHLLTLLQSITGALRHA